MSIHQQRKYKIFVNYFIQNDSWESINQPNLFVIPDEFHNLNDVKAQIIYDNFPLISHFNYYLRFYLNDKTQGVNGWIDYPPNATVPVYNNGHVYVKALRIPKNIKINFKNSDLFQRSSSTHHNKTSQNNNKNLLNINEKSEENKFENKNKKSGFVIPEGINFGEIENNLKDNNDNTNVNNNMNMNNSSIHKQNTNPKVMNMPLNNNNDNNNNNIPNPNIQRSNTNSKTPTIINNNTTKFQELNFDNIFSSNNNNNMNNNMNNNNNNMNNINNMNNNIPNNFSFQNQKRSQSPKLDSNLNSIDFNIPIDTGNSSENNNNNTQQTYDFTSSNKKKYPIDNIPNTLPEDDIKERVDKIIKEWTMGVNEKKSLLFLITTLHEVWTNDPKLETPQMQQLVNDKSMVRTYYKKAMRILHSDKNKDKDFKTKYIAESLYQILNEANSSYF